MNEGGLFDVVVLGGGPAGCAAALTLRLYSSLSVAVIEKSCYDAPRIGETLSPGVQGLLRYLNVWDRFVAGGHQPSYGTSAAWGSSEVQTRDFIFTPFGAGWHLDRRQFDSMLAEGVTAAGGALFRNTRMIECQRTPENRWCMAIDVEGKPFEIQARFVVDSTGKAAAFARKESVSRRRVDRMVAVAGTFQFQSAAPRDTLTLIETCEDGWWYSALLPGGSMMVAFLSDSDIAKERGMLSNAAWLKGLGRMERTSERVRDGHMAADLEVHAAHSAFLVKAFGEGWVAAGDAAASFDPLSSSGIPRALYSGIWGARAIYDLLERGRSDSLESYDANLKLAFDLYEKTRARYYQLERRWKDAPFWSRRQRNHSSGSQ